MPSDPPITPARLAALAALTHHRWSIPLITLCAESPVYGWKYITFIKRLGISRESLGRTLAALIEQAWAMSNPGVGHALRPEYVLTTAGRRIAKPASAVLTELKRLDEEALGLQKWTLPIVAALSTCPRRFAELRAILGEVSPRAASLALRDLEDQGMIKRNVRDTYPPTSEYALARRSLRLAVAVRRLVREVGLRATPKTQSPVDRERVRKSA